MVRGPAWLAMAIALAVTVAGLCGWGAGIGFRPLPPIAAGMVLPLETEAQIDAETPQRLEVIRFADNPAVVVLDFASLGIQGQMLNRIAAFVEKAGASHDHVLNDAALSLMIHASGAAPETYYYGHDYRAADLARFFHLADRDHVSLNKQEEWLRALIGRLGWLSAAPAGALITVPRAGADADIDAPARQVILHHELSHAEYFTYRAYAKYSEAFWNNALTASERDQFRRFLAADGYDAGIEDLMINEMQAYLIHTRDPRFFSAANVGLSPSRERELQRRFIDEMPRGWLQRATPDL